MYTYHDFGRLTDIDAESDAYGQFMGFERGGYDYNGNPRYTYYAHNEDRSELYGTHTGQDPEGNADALNRLTRFRRGTLNANKDDLTTTVYEQDWHDTTDALTLDKLGNWDAVRLDEDGDDTASSMTSTERGHNTANEYTSLNGSAAYAHDRNGNLTDDEEFTFYYDFANHLVRAVKQSTGDTVGAYRYDAIGRRVRKVVDDVNDTLDGTTLFFYDGMQVIEDGMLDGNGTYTAQRQYLWGFYLDELLVFDYDAQGDFDLEDVSDQRHYCFQDFTYSTVAVMDPDGNIDERYDYEPYGRPNIWTPDYADTRAETAVHLDVLFTGQRYDPETGLYHYKARALQATLGRFMQRDPARSVGGLPRRSDASRATDEPYANAGYPRQYRHLPHLYVYARLNPLVALDPDGAWTRELKSITVKALDVEVDGDLGHAWIDINGTESYGWYPSKPVSGLEAVTGLRGEINAVSWRAGGGASPTKDPHHDDAPDRSFHPYHHGDGFEIPLLGWWIGGRMKFGPKEGVRCPCVTESDIHECIRAYAAYKDSNRHRWDLLNNNCYAFTNRVIRKCCMAHGPRGFDGPQ